MNNFLQNLFSHIPKEFYLPIGLASLGLILFAYGLIQYSNSQKTKENLPEAIIEVTQSPVKTVKNIQIDVEGGVFHPGVYSVAFDSRVQDALIAAGGLSGQADRDYVAKHINLAAKITDGAKIYIPRAGENILDGAQSNPETALDNAGMININSATADQLDSLPGIGAATAEKIITNRPYDKVEDLVTKKVVGQKVFNEIKDKITLF